jgi:glycosyltransferase involved in cell wall biosynthesis
MIQQYTRLLSSFWTQLVPSALSAPIGRSHSRPLHVMFLGLRDIEGGQGGVENHVAQLAVRLAAAGNPVTVLARKPYCRAECNTLPGIAVVALPAPRRASLEALVHSVIGVAHAAIRRPDILHIHAIGPSIVVPLARMAGLKVVVTHHGKDYDREKWGRLARFVLKAGEFCQGNFAQGRIVISASLRDELATIYPGRLFTFIPNGAPPLTRAPAMDEITRIDARPGRYIFSAGRFVPEKRQLDLIRAFAVARLPEDVKLVIAGAADHPSDYSRALENAASATPGVVLTGFAGGERLRQYFSHAGVFALPSSHEGLPIALLEAMRFGLPIVASDIAGNLELGLGDSAYFETGNVGQLASRFEAAFSENQTPPDWSEQSARYDWDRITTQTLSIYNSVSRPSPVIGMVVRFISRMASSSQNISQSLQDSAGSYSSKRNKQ